jgi:maleylacetate reductase
MTPVWGMTEGRRKTTGRSLDVLPAVVIYDPELTVTLPAAVTGPSAMNAIAHCVEALYVPAANPVTSMLATRASARSRRARRRRSSEPHDIDARTLTLYGAYLAGSAFAAVGGGLHHKICHILGGALDLPHAETHTVVLPHVVAFFTPAIPAVMARVAARSTRAPGRGPRRPRDHAGADAVDAAPALYDLGRRLRRAAGAARPRHARERPRADDRARARGHRRRRAGDHPRTVDEPAIRAILTGAFEGRTARPVVARGGRDSVSQREPADPQPQRRGAHRRRPRELRAAPSSPRFKQIAQSLVRHLHAFVAEVEPTEQEWAAAIDFLTRTGQISDDRRQEFILLSDVLGVSMLVIGINHRVPDGATESTVFGPFFVAGAPEVANGGDIAAGAPGIPCLMSGRVRSVDGTPLAGAVIDVWQADEAGFYDVQYPGLEPLAGRAQLRARDDGSFSFWSVLPTAYPIPATARRRAARRPPAAGRCARRTCTSWSQRRGMRR